MSSVDYGSDVVTNSVDNFWDMKHYLGTVKRLENGNKLCSELCNMVHERADIEKLYASSLNKWSAKWEAFTDNGPEFGSVQTLWRGVCKEAERLATLHQEIRQQLLDNVQASVKVWQKCHFHRMTLPLNSLKESRLLESQFEVAQKPWAKRHKKMMLVRKHYHNACKAVKSAMLQQQNAKNDLSTTTEQHRKIQDRVRKAEREVELTKSQYQASLKDLETDNPRYMYDMTTVFEKAQQWERERLDFFKKTFMDLYDVIDISTNQELPSIYVNLKGTVDEVNPEEDLKVWSKQNGADMPFQFPIFEEYAPELHSISSKKGGGVLDGTVTLTGIYTPRGSVAEVETGRRTNGEINGEGRGDVSNGSATVSPTVEGSNRRKSDSYTAHAEHRTHATDIEDRRMSAGDCYLSHADQRRENVPLSNGNRAVGQACSPLMEADERPGVLVRALYDYTGLERDELCFSVGDVLEKLDDEDEQGWCKGRKEGRLGLYPANYVEPV